MSTTKKKGPDSIILVAIDLDGTLLTPESTLTARNASAIRRACSAEVSVILATGKSRASAHEVIEELDLRMPGVFTQGTTIYDAKGDIWHETSLEKKTAAGVLQFAEERELPYIAYAGERILTPAESRFRRQLHDQYREPLPEIAGSLLPQLERLAINKLVVCDPVDDGVARAALEELCAEEAHVTQAVPHFIEVLPGEASKGAGLRWLLEQMNVSPQQVMAIGDGENDVEMFQLVGLGIAMGNAHPRVKAVADHVVTSNRHSGVAEAIERFVLATTS